MIHSCVDANDALEILGRLERTRAHAVQLEEAIEKAKLILMEYQQGESGLPFKPAKDVVRPALEALASTGVDAKGHHRGGVHG